MTPGRIRCRTDGTVAFFELDTGLKPGLYERVNLAKDAGVAIGAPSATEFSLGVRVGSRDEVDQMLAQAESAARAYASDRSGQATR